MTSPAIQGFSETLRLAASVSPLILLPGVRQHDRFVITDGEGKPRIASLDGLVWSALGDLAAEYRYDPATAHVSLFKTHPQVRLSGGGFPVQPGVPWVSVGKTDLLNGFLSLKAEGAPDASQHLLLLVDAGLLFQDPSHPVEADYLLLQALEHFARSQTQSPYRLFLRTPNLAAIPAALTNSPWVRVVNLPAAERDERLAYARLRGLHLAEQCRSDLDALTCQLTRVSDDWRLEELEGLIQTCEKHPLTTVADLEPVARTFRLGAARSPWAGAEIRAAIARAPKELAQRVRGQPEALAAVCTKLRKAVTGLSGAHQSGLSRGPRAVYVFAGSTGVGKTEMAKGLASLVYGDEGALIRFDCAEFAQEHTVARLLGAPPGFIGHEAGGELIERIRVRPFSVVLFDEIEKAHPRIFDIFLSILDDGRLTDGQGVTADFSECVLIFTTNLGVYAESPDGLGGVVRQPRFQYDSPYSEIATAIRTAIRDEFVSRLGRPELLGRLGGVERGVQVFDCLRDLEGVTRKFITNIEATVKRLHSITLTTDPQVIDLIVRDAAGRPDALVLGARGVAQSVEALFSDPLADILSATEVPKSRLHARCCGWQVEFS